MTSENNDFILELPSDEDLSTDKNRRVKSKESYPPKIHQDDGKDSKKTIMILGVVSIVIILIIAFLIFPINIDDLTDEEEDYTPVSGTISAEIDEIDNTGDGEADTDILIINFDTIGTPFRPGIDSIEIFIDGNEIEGFDDADADINGNDYEWGFLSDGNIRSSGSSLTLTEDFSDEIDSNVDEVEIFFDGYSGSLNASL